MSRPIKAFGLILIEFVSASRIATVVQHRSAIQVMRTSGGIVNRNFIVLGIGILAVASAVYAQDDAKPATKKSGSSSASSAAAERGKEVFEKKCSVCHYADSDAKKIGPGLKGIGKRGTFTVNNNKVTDESLKTWIENGDTMMPPFKEVLEPAQIKDVVAYVKSL
jgi:mono/diheme cytochrome c family protein